MQQNEELFSVLDAESNDDFELANVLAMTAADGTGDTCCSCSTGTQPQV